MNKSRSSQQSEPAMNLLGWTSVITLTLVAAFVLYRVAVGFLYHWNEVVAINYQPGFPQ